jgi:hypothetical protein
MASIFDNVFVGALLGIASQPWWVRGLIGAAIGGAILILLPPLWKTGKDSAAEQKSTSTPIHINQVGSGGPLTNVINSNVTVTAAPEMARPVQAARIVVSKFMLSPANTSDPNSHFGWRLYMINRGTIAGYAPELTFSTVIKDHPLSDSEIDKAMESSKALALERPPKRSQHIEVGQEYWLEINQRVVRAEDFAAIRAGQKHLYVWTILLFADDVLPKDKFWVSEYCGTQNRDMDSIRICAQRTYLH